MWKLTYFAIFLTLFLSVIQGMPSAEFDPTSNFGNEEEDVRTNIRTLDHIGASYLNGRALDHIGGNYLNGRTVDHIGGSYLNGRTLDHIGGSYLNGRTLDHIGGSYLNGRNTRFPTQYNDQLN